MMKNSCKGMEREDAFSGAFSVGDKLRESRAPARPACKSTRM